MIPFDKEKALRAWAQYEAWARYETQYPSFNQNPACRCYPDALQAALCLTGHLLECHYPKSCKEAECGHYRRTRAAEEGW